MPASHLYVHIPFCRSRCAYCDFVSQRLPATGADSLIDGYLAALRRELRAKDSLLARPLETVYVGGGTPTALPPGRLLPLVRELAAFLSSPGCLTAEGNPRLPGGPTADPGPAGELTVEANPGTIDTAYLEALRDAGASRLSLGIESFNQTLREALGRHVTQEETEAAAEAVSAAGWEDWNLDLVLGIPGQTERTLQHDLRRAVDCGPTHISLYDLTYTDSYSAWVQRRLGARVRREAGKLAEEHYGEAVAFLEAAGYERYETSNFALPGRRSRHNAAYWRGEDYVGVGAGAVETIGHERRSNPGSVGDYLQGKKAVIETLSPEQKTFELAMLGLRTVEGVREADVERMLEKEALEQMVRAGYVRRVCGTLSFSSRGFNVANSVLAAILRLPVESEFF